MAIEMKLEFQFMKTLWRQPYKAIWSENRLPQVFLQLGNCEGTNFSQVENILLSVLFF